MSDSEFRGILADGGAEEVRARLRERPNCEEWEYWRHAVICRCEYCREAGHGNLIYESEGGYGE